MGHSVRWLAWLGLLSVVVLSSGCLFGGGDERDGLFEETGPLSEDEIETIEEDIQKLSAASSMENDPDDEAQFWQSVQDLTVHGSIVEPYLLEALAANDDWAIRYGVIHVLDSVGTRAAVEPLIRTLDDEHYLVSMKAVYTLRVMTGDHREIPEEGSEVGANTLPPVGQPDENDFDPGASERMWIKWHTQHATTLRDSWLKWWSENGRNTPIN